MRAPLGLPFGSSPRTDNLENATPQNEDRSQDQDGGTDNNEENEEAEKKLESRKRRASKLLESSVPSRTGKRERKSAETFVPASFIVDKPRVKIFKGRGAKLSDIPSVRESIEAAQTPDLAAAHKFVFTFRGKVSNHEKKGNLLSFSGFLTPIEPDEEKEKRDKIDEDAEVRLRI